ncbi:class I SAM-dependent methyltransferase [Geobacter argillaceus]|uniref:Methyltransferase family protein n=1 Tax=Geobacter argillaceus TaxID=345631 RepID=A0A562VNB5_9BACT|nr:class I SAM-dependent methyltransferase [Geobacter argillaceus]TWJ19292.1 methyltransferase family protein [Geobacter argillaceus]
MGSQSHAINNHIHYDQCPLCSSADIEKIGDITYPDPLTFSSNPIELIRTPELWNCSGCLSWFTQNILPPETAEMLYQTGNSGHKWPSSDGFCATKPAEITDTLKRLFAGSPKVLDIGCNTGELLDFASGLDCLTTGVELSEHSRELLASKGHAGYEHLDLITSETFDVIVAFDLIEHLHEPGEFISKCGTLLKAGGLLILLTGNNSSFSARRSREKWWYVAFPEHIVFPSPLYLSSIRGFLLETGMPVFNTRAHQYGFVKRIKTFVKGMVTGNYTGTPSLVPDHMLAVLRKTKSCSICGSYDAEVSFKVYDDRFAYPGNFVITTCKHCTHKQLAANHTQEMIGRLYTEYYPRATFDIDTYKPFAPSAGFVSWLNGDKASAFRWVPERVKILDVGCGFGETLGYHKNRGCEVHGVEADESIRRVADRFGYSVHVGLFDPDIYEPGYFDYITLDQVIEHTIDPIETLKGIARVLKPGGTLIISTPNAESWGVQLFGRRWIHWHTPYHLQLFTKKSLEYAARSAGLTLKSHKSITCSEWLYYQWIHLFTAPEMGTTSPFWMPRSEKKWQHRLAMKILKLMHRTKINHLITRFFDYLGLGDNRIYFLTK